MKGKAKKLKRFTCFSCELGMFNDNGVCVDGSRDGETEDYKFQKLANTLINGAIDDYCRKDPVKITRSVRSKNHKYELKRIAQNKQDAEAFLFREPSSLVFWCWQAEVSVGAVRRRAKERNEK